MATLFPKGIHGCIGDFLSECDDIEVRLAALDTADNQKCGTLGGSRDYRI